MDNLHNNFFQKVFSEVANTEIFLKVALPAALLNRLDFSEISLDPISYISEEYKASFSDLVVKCRTQAEEVPVDIYILFEHKSYQDKGVLVQLLRYMSLMWQRDSDEKKPLRVIVPLVFYHGEGSWQIPAQFVEQFSIADEWKPFLLNFSYVLFDATAWDWQAESSQPLRENVFLLSAMMLMKAAFSRDLQLIRQMFQLWHQIGFMREKERINFLLIYVAETQDISIATLQKIAEETKLQGEQIMPTLAQRLREEGIEKGIERGYLLDRQEVLILLLSTRFHLSDSEKQAIRAVNELEKLTAALKLVVKAQTQEEVMESLKSSHLNETSSTHSANSN